MRESLPGQHSVERLFESVCEQLPADIDAEIVRLPFPSQGFVPRLRNLTFTARLRADIIHVTGDVHYCALAVPRHRCLLTVLDHSSLHRLGGLRRWTYFLLWFRLPAWWATRITVISRATRDELVRGLPTTAAKTSIIPCPVGGSFLTVRRTPKQGRLFQVLMVGTGANKNLERMVRALESLPVHIRIIGALSPEQCTLLEASAVSYSAVAELSDEQMVREYAESDVLSFISTYEGFGLPIIEAQAVGLPVVTSNISSMPEVAGDGALLVDPFDVKAIEDAVALLIEKPDVAQVLTEKGFRNVESFRPDTIAEMYGQIYRNMGLPR